MNVNKNHQNYKRTIQDVDSRTTVEAKLREAHATYGVEQLQAKVKFDIQADCSNTNDDTMYPAEASIEWLNNRNRSRNTNENYQRNLANYEYNEDEDINCHSNREPNEVDNYNDYNFDGRKSALTSTAVNTSYCKNMRNLANLITHSKDEATHRDFKVYEYKTHATDNKASASKNKYAEKTTYCRPVFNVFRQDYIYKAIERNAKLQLLLKKLVIARRKEKEEKERGEWNNYVNKLKNSGHYLSNESRHIEPQHIEPRHFELRHMEPRHMERRHIEPRHIEPRHIEPRHMEPRQMEPRHMEPRHMEPGHFESLHIESRHVDPRQMEPRHIEPRQMEPRHFESLHTGSRHMDPRQIESRHIEPRRNGPWHIESRHMEPQHTESRHIESRHNEPGARIYFEQHTQTHELINNPSSELIYDPPYRSMHEHEQEHTKPRFNNHPEHKRISVGPGFENGFENSPSPSITSSIDRLLTLATLWQLSAPHTIAVDCPRSPSGIPVVSGKYKDDSKGYYERYSHAIEKEDESSRETNPATTTGGVCKTCLVAYRKEESSRETNSATTTGGHCKTCPFANRKEESSRETYPANTTGGVCKTCLVAYRKEESLRESYPTSTTSVHFKTSLVPGRKEEESLREKYPATTMGGYCKKCLLANRKEESSRESNPGTTTLGGCKACLLASMKEVVSSMEAYPATTTGGLCKTCLLANRKDESSRETNPGTTTGDHFKTSLVPGMKEEESLWERYPATTTGDNCKACLLASMKEVVSSMEAYPTTNTGFLCNTCLLANRKDESLRETNPGITTGSHFKTSLVPGMKEEESLRETYPATTTGDNCKSCLLASMKKVVSSMEANPATTTGGLCKTCLLANRKEESSRETDPSTTTGGCKMCLVANRKEESSSETSPATTTGDHFETSLVPGGKEEESSRETYPVTTTGVYCKACPCLIASMKEEESSRDTEVTTQTTSIAISNIEFIITDPEATKDKYEEITLNVNRLKNLIDLQDQEKQHRNSLSGLETKMESLANSIKAILSKLESARKISSTPRVSLVHTIKNMEKGTSASGDNAVHVVENMAKFTSTVHDCDVLVGEPAERPERPVLPERPEHPEHPEHPEQLKKLEHPGPPFDTYSLQTKYVLRPIPTKYRNISSSTSKIDKIMCEELVKSNQLRKDIEEILCQSNSACAVQISFDIPTRERCTEVTDSLSKTKLMEEQEISIEELSLSGDKNRQVTIAVNTDPMGLLAWFRMSSDTLKQLISYVPSVDYSRYLLRSPLPQLTTAVVDYVCNVCGACFSRPSLLNDHIRTHDLTDSRNCCICHHVLNIKPGSARSAARFACRYCGRRFTRAYCCELHEQSCARAMGRNHDVRSGHGLLR